LESPEGRIYLQVAGWLVDDGTEKVGDAGGVLSSEQIR
jgi:hypothetical protein